MKNLIIITLVANVLCASVLCASAQASIVLTSDALSTPLTMDAGSLSAEEMTLAVSSDDAPNDEMVGWMVSLQIVPETGATGRVNFQSAQVPTLNYVFGTSTSFFDTTISGTTSGTLAGSDTLKGYGMNFSSILEDPIVIPGVPGLNLLSFTFASSQDASGSFGIYVLPALSLWADGTSDHDFVSTAQPQLVGTINVTAIPEPTSIVIMMGLIAFSAFFDRRRSR